MKPDDEYAMAQWLLCQKNIDKEISIQEDTLISYIKRNKGKFKKKEVRVLENNTFVNKEMFSVDTYYRREILYCDENKENKGEFYKFPTFKVASYNKIAKKIEGAALRELVQDEYFVERLTGVPRIIPPKLGGN